MRGSSIAHEPRRGRDQGRGSGGILALPASFRSKVDEDPARSVGRLRVDVVVDVLVLRITRFDDHDIAGIPGELVGMRLATWRQLAIVDGTRRVAPLSPDAIRQMRAEVAVACAGAVVIE